MDDARFSRLSNRQRDVLRGVAALKRTKQIAVELGIAPGTVDGYIAEAVRALGATDRGEAARGLLRYEAAAPGKSGVQSSWVGGVADTGAGRPPPVAEPETPSRIGQDAEVARPLSWMPLPIRRKGQRGNDLSVGARLLWIPAIALILAIGFGMLANGLKVLADLIERLSHLIR